MRLKKSHPILTALSSVLIALALTLTVSPLTAQTSKEKIRLLSAALRAHDAGDLQAAKTNLEALIKIAPDDPNVQKLLKAVNEDLARQGRSTIAAGSSAPVAATIAPMTPSAPTAAPSAPFAAPAPALPSAPSPALPAPSSPSGFGKTDLMAQAIQARDAGNLELAKEKLEQLKAQYPDDPNVQRMLDDVNRRMGGTSSTSFDRPSAPSAPRSAAPSVPGAKASSPASGSGNAQSLLQEEYNKQRSSIAQAMKHVHDARGLAMQGNYDEAINMLDATQEKIPFSSATMSVLEDIQEEKIQIALAKARQTRKEADRNQANNFFKEYEEMFGDSPRTRYLADEVESVVKNPWLRDAEEVSPEWSKTQAVIDDLIVKARSQMLVGDYQGAQTTLKQVEIRDPDNLEAKALQVRISKMLNDAGRYDHLKTREQMLEEVNRAWQRPQVYAVKDEVEVVVDPNDNLFKKLRAITIPKVSFSDMPLDRVINTLSELSVQYDNTTEIEAEKGVNMIVMDPTKINPSVTITLRNFSMEKILEFVTKSVNFQYNVENDAVVVRGGGTETTLDTAFYPLPRATVIRMIGVPNEESGGGGGGSPFGGDPFGGGGGGGGGSAEVDEGEQIKSFLERAGVPFSSIPGASLAYDGTQIIVTQSARHHERILTILRKYDETKQVEIEAKFLEVQQGTLEELGFDWMISNNNGLNLFSTGPTQIISTAAGGNAIDRLNDDIKEIYTVNNVSAGTNPIEFSNLNLPPNYLTLVEDQLINPDTSTTKTAISSYGTGALRTLQQSFLTTQRSGTSQVIVGGKTYNAGGLPPQLPGSASLGGNQAAVDIGYSLAGLLNIQTVIHALEQQTGSDMLTAPRVTVLSGKTATINVSQEFRYPTSYGDMESEVGGGGSDNSAGSASVSITPGTPQDFETENLGVVMEVTPTVEDDNSINLRMNPRVTEFEGFVEYGGSALAVSNETVVQLPSGFFQPVFSVREVRTEVTIFDGATVVLGGLVREEVKSFNDSIPVLGDIPLLGRLFRSEGETRQKRNLLIFVNANLVSAGGSPIKDQAPGVQANSLFQNPIIVTPGGAVARKVDEEAEK